MLQEEYLDWLGKYADFPPGSHLDFGFFWKAQHFSYPLATAFQPQKYMHQFGTNARKIVDIWVPKSLYRSLKCNSTFEGKTSSASSSLIDSRQPCKGKRFYPVKGEFSFPMLCRENYYRRKSTRTQKPFGNRLQPSSCLGKFSLIVRFPTSVRLCESSSSEKWKLSKAFNKPGGSTCFSW